MWTGLLDLLFPPGCAACGARPAAGPFCAGCSSRIETLPQLRCPRCAGPLPTFGRSDGRREGEGAPLCPDCAEALPPFVRLTACFVHGGAVADAIHRLKYRGRREVARPLGGLLATVARLDRDAVDGIVPIPLHRSRLRERGFDQAALLARALSRQLGLPLLVGLLRRTRDTAHQVGLDRAGRRRNVAGAFRASPRAVGRRLLLVDDVVTTCATAREASRALLDAGAREVRVVAVARAGL